MPTLEALPPLYSCGHQLEAGEDKIGFLQNSNDALDDRDELRGRMDENGYLLLRNHLDVDEVMAARRHVFQQLAGRDLLDPSAPLMDGVPNSAAHLYFQPELAQKNNAPLQHLLYNPNGAIMQFFQFFLGGAVRHFDFTWLRCITPGGGTPSHCDIVYMSRGTRRLYTAWVPLGDVDFNLGGLMVLEGSHKNEKLRNSYGQRDVDVYCTNRPDDPAKTAHGTNGWLSENPTQIRRSLGGRWLVSEYQAGDILIFCMDMVHGGMDNRSNRLRLSSDSRYQLASEPIDERWIGENPPGHGAAGKRGRIC
jgi:Phytanoyl-CoA dioxygenase (PhyH)